MDQPDFQSLPIGPSPEIRWVGGTLMTRDQYLTEGWHRRGTFTVAHPHQPGCLLESREVGTWEATREGLIEYGKKRGRERSERREIRKTLDAREDEFREYVDSLEDAKAPWKKGREEDG